MSDRIILASASVGRRMLFEQMVRDFVIEVSGVDEESLGCEDPRELPRVLAEAKGREVARRFPHDYVFAFDTVVLCEGRIIGKPRDLEKAREFLAFLSGKRQSVLSGYAFVREDRGIFESGVEETVLSFAPLSSEFIESYVRTHPVTRFAGGYAIQHDDQFIRIEEGSFDVIVGAPMDRVRDFLKRMGLSHLLIRDTARL